LDYTVVKIDKIYVFVKNKVGWVLVYVIYIKLIYTMLGQKGVCSRADRLTLLP